MRMISVTFNLLPSDIERVKKIADRLKKKPFTLLREVILGWLDTMEAKLANEDTKS